METKFLTIFREVARHDGFAPAARVLELDPSAVSRAIAALEQDLGARLFQRTTRRVALTDAGLRFLAKIDPILAELDDACEDLRATEAAPSGQLKVTASVAFGQVCIMPHISTFMALYPEIDLTLDFTDRMVDLVAERVDLAIRLAPMVTGDLIAAKLMDTRYRVCASPDYLKRAPAISKPDHLTAHRGLCFDLPGFDAKWRFRAHPDGTVNTIPIVPRLKVSGALPLRDAARAGLGPALLADWLVDEDIRAGRLVDLFPGQDATATEFDTAAWLIYPSRAFLPRKTRAFIDFLRGRIPTQQPD